MFRSIHVSDEVQVFLDSHRRHRHEPYNQVIRRLIGLDPALPAGPGGRDIGRMLTAAQRAVLDVLATGVTMTAAQISSESSVSSISTGIALRHLERLGVVRRQRVLSVTHRWHDEWRIAEGDGTSDQGTPVPGCG